MVVTHDPGPWLDETLVCLGRQSYPNLSVLLVDAGSAVDPTPQVARILPSAYVRRVDASTGFAAAANEVLDLVEGAAFFCFCHDDVALDRDSIRLLVEESFRSNAGIAGPKLVDWDDPRRLDAVGFSIDKVGELAPYADRGELDQEQHDAVRDVFCVSGACMLVRADLFAHLHGFDPAIERHGEELNLAWRAHVAGARVVVVPGARVRHRGSAAAIDNRRDADRMFQRHRVRTLLTCYSRWSLLRIVPQALGLALLEAVYGMFAGRSDQVREVLGPWTWNLRRFRAIRARRRQLAALRKVSDREVRHLQVAGSARVSAFMRGQIGGGDDRLRAMARPRDIGGTFRAGPRRTAAVVIFVVGVVLVLGSRQLLFGHIPAVGEFARFPAGPGALLRSWWNGWRNVGVGAPGGAPTPMGAFGLGGVVFFGAMGQLRKVLILAALPIGAWGVWRMAKPIGSRRARIAALIVYVAIPVPYNAIAQGRWGGLALYAFSPWLLLGLCRAAGVAPFGRLGMRPGDVSTIATRPTRPVPSQIIGLGLTLAMASIITPFAFGVVAVMALTLALGSLVVFRETGALRTIAVAVGALVIAALLHLPWALGFFKPGTQWSVFAGPGASVGGNLSVGRLLRFESGPYGAAPLGWVFIAAAALPLLIGRGWRLDWAARCWTMAIGFWTLLWLGQENWLPVSLPPPEVLLAPVAAGLALATALGMASFEVDLPSYRFGWRQAVSLLAGLAVIAGAVTVIGGAFNGRWKMPAGDLDSVLGSYITPPPNGPRSRAMWVGDPQSLPVGAWRLDDRLAFGTSNQGPARIDELWATPSPGQSARMGDSLRLALAGDTTQLGHLLAPMGVRYIVVPDQIAPIPYDTQPHPAPIELKTALAAQLDLRPNDIGNAAVTVYENTAWRTMPVRVGSETHLGSHFTDAAAITLPNDPAADHAASATEARGTLSSPGQVVLDRASDPRWHLSVNGQSARRTSAFGWATAFTSSVSGRTHVWYGTPLLIYLLLIVQVLAWIVAIGLWRRARAGDRRREAHDVRVLIDEGRVGVTPTMIAEREPEVAR